MLEHKFCAPADGAPLALGEGAVLAGYASVFGQRDQGGDLVMPGAYLGALARLGAKGIRVKMLWQHNPAEPIGVWDEVREDQHGLWVKGRILTDLARGREAARLVAAGAIDGLSIGYKALRAEREARGRRLHELELWEVSLVTFPMQIDARVVPDVGAATKRGQADRDIHLPRKSQVNSANTPPCGAVNETLLYTPLAAMFEAARQKMKLG